MDSAVWPCFSTGGRGSGRRLRWRLALFGGLCGSLGATGLAGGFGCFLLAFQVSEPTAALLYFIGLLAHMMSPFLYRDRTVGGNGFKPHFLKKCCVPAGALEPYLPLSKNRPALTVIMATPSNAREPDSSQEEEQEEILDTGFDAMLFWDRYRQPLLIGISVVLLGLAGYGFYTIHQSTTAAAAGAALASASTEDDYRAVIDKYAGTPAAGNAALLLASRLREDKKYDDAIQTLQTFLDKSPTHPLASGGDLAIGEILEAEGKKDDAIAKYQEVAAKYPDSYAAPVAVLDQANLLTFEGKNDDAKRVYQDFVAQFPDSIFVQQAMAEMRMLRVSGSSAAAGTAAPAATPVSPESLPSIKMPGQ
jgi:predicted negative regulator of RcsB-dependent stress response